MYNYFSTYLPVGKLIFILCDIMEKLTLEELSGAALGKGTERACFLAPGSKNDVIKLSPAGQDRQTRREIDYFRFLQRKGVPFLHIPQFKGEVSVPGYVGFKQEAVLDEGGKVSGSLQDFLQAGDSSLREMLPGLLRELYGYLWRYNVLPCDLNPSNILLQRRAEGVRLVLIDGLGSMNLIHFSQYVPFLGRKQISRKWRRFIRRDIEPYLKEKKLL